MGTTCSLYWLSILFPDLVPHSTKICTYYMQAHQWWVKHLFFHVIEGLSWICLKSCLWHSFIICSCCIMVRLLLCLWWSICNYLQQLRVCDETSPHSEAGDCHVCWLLHLWYLHMHSWHKIHLERRFWLLFASYHQRCRCSWSNDFRKILHPCISWQLGLRVFQLCHESEVAIP